MHRFVAKEGCIDPQVAVKNFFHKYRGNIVRCSFNPKTKKCKLHFNHPVTTDWLTPRLEYESITPEYTSQNDITYDYVLVVRDMVENDYDMAIKIVMENGRERRLQQSLECQRLIVNRSINDNASANMTPLQYMNTFKTEVQTKQITQNVACWVSFESVEDNNTAEVIFEILRVMFPRKSDISFMDYDDSMSEVDALLVAKTQQSCYNVLINPGVIGKSRLMEVRNDEYSNLMNAKKSLDYMRFINVPKNSKIVIGRRFFLDERHLKRDDELFTHKVPDLVICCTKQTEEYMKTKFKIEHIIPYSSYMDNIVCSHQPLDIIERTIVRVLSETLSAFVVMDDE